MKGILHPDDARKAVDHGVAGVIVSNHGDRQLDPRQSRCSMPCPRSLTRSETRQTVLFDSGIRRGGDGVNAIALGRTVRAARRALFFGLAANGEQGVRDDRNLEFRRSRSDSRFLRVFFIHRPWPGEPGGNLVCPVGFL